MGMLQRPFTMFFARRHIFYFLKTPTIFEYELFMCVHFSYFLVFLKLCSVRLTVPWQVEQQAALGFCSDVVNRKSVPTSKKQQGNRFFPLFCTLGYTALVAVSLRPVRPYFITTIQILLQCHSTAKHKYKYMMWASCTQDIQ